LGLRQAFSSAYVVQDDVRQHVFWMWRYVDSSLLPQDLIADYFQSVAPIGYKNLYRLATSLGIQPILCSKLLPSILGVLGTVYSFLLCLEIIPLGMVAFLASVILNQSLWMGVDLASATPRAFIYPLFLAFLYYLTRRSAWGVGLTVLLQGLFYPPLVLLASGLLAVRLVDWQTQSLRLTRDRAPYQLAAIGIGMGILVLLPHLLFSSAYGPTITAAQARTWPEFLPQGRSVFFDDNAWFYWLGGDSGFLHRGLTEPLTLVFSLFLPGLWLGRSRFPLFQFATGNLQLLPQLLLTSTGLFLAAHALLFKLYAPNRYTQHTLRIVMAIAAALLLVALVDGLWQGLAQGKRFLALRQGVAGIALVLVVGIVVLYPCFMESFLEVEYVQGKYPELYGFLQQQPTDSLVASLAPEADNIGTFSARSVLVSREHSRPYDLGYYGQFRQRVVDLIEAQYSSDLTQVQDVTLQYQIDFWLLDANTFNLDFLAQDNWLQQFQPHMQQAIDQLQTGPPPALIKVPDSCTAFSSNDIKLLQASCLLKL
jgi:hypothetical protein